MKLRQLLILGCLVFTGHAFGSVTLNFNVAGADNFGNSTGVATDGMFWGILIDSSGNGFNGSYRPPASLTLGTTYSLTTSLDAVSDDVLILSNFATYTGDNNPGTLFDVGPFDLSVAVTTLDVFRVVWFSGNDIGTLADASFTIPADSALQDYTAPFVGADPVRSAGLAYSGTSAVSTGVGMSFVPIPEPSAGLIGALGALGLLRRRRI